MSIVTAVNKLQGYTTNIQSRTHTIIADEPKSLGGEDQGSTPMELMCAALASCTTITLRMYLNRKEWAVEQIEVEVAYLKETGFDRKVTFTGELDDTQRDRLLKIADACPVHKLLSVANVIRTRIANT